MMVTTTTMSTVKTNTEEQNKDNEYNDNNEYKGDNVYQVVDGDDDKEKKVIMINTILSAAIWENKYDDGNYKPT